MPAHFEQASTLVTPEMTAAQTVCGPDAARHVAAIQEFVAAGYSEVFVSQIGPEQEGFFDFFAAQVMPELR